MAHQPRGLLDRLAFMIFGQRSAGSGDGNFVPGNGGSGSNRSSRHVPYDPYWDERHRRPRRRRRAQQAAESDGD